MVRFYCDHKRNSSIVQPIVIIVSSTPRTAVTDRSFAPLQDLLVSYHIDRLDSLAFGEIADTHRAQQLHRRDQIGRPGLWIVDESFKEGDSVGKRFPADRANLVGRPATPIRTAGMVVVAIRSSERL